MTWWQQVLISGALASVVGTVISVMANRKKLGAEATEVITKAASGVVSDMREDNARLRASDRDKTAQIANLEERVDDLENEQRAWEYEREDWLRVLQLHAAWDTLAIAKLRSASPPIDLPDPPPLSAPVRYRNPNKQERP